MKTPLQPGRRMKTHRLTACALFGHGSAALAEIETFWTRDTLTGDWGGRRTQLIESGFKPAR